MSSDTDSYSEKCSKNMKFGLNNQVQREKNGPIITNDIVRASKIAFFQFIACRHFPSLPSKPVTPFISISNFSSIKQQ